MSQNTKVSYKAACVPSNCSNQPALHVVRLKTIWILGYRQSAVRKVSIVSLPLKALVIHVFSKL